MPLSSPIRSRQLTICAAIGLVLVFASCDKSPTRPNILPPPPPPPGGSSPATVVRIELVAPPEIAPGESVQLTANAVKSDDSVENVSAQAQWTSSGSTVLQLSSSGLATGKTRGEAFVMAHYGGRSASARIFVLPQGTFRLAGTVKEDGVGVQSVRVTVVSGVGESLTATSDFSGNYVLYGVSGTLRIQIGKSGYLNGFHDVTVTAHRTADFDIVPERPRTDYRGTYTLTITAASTCRALPEPARQRQYTANVTQDGARLTVTLSDANFIVVNGRGNSFAGYIDITDTIKFTIGEVFIYYYYYFPSTFDIAERVGTTTVLAGGVASPRGSPAFISGKLDGAIVISSSPSPPFSPFTSWCGSTAHGFEMVRR